jgi:putative iron-dependent peroxidase
VPPGAYDRLLDFSTAVTGATFYVPTAPMLEALATAVPEPAAARVEPDDATAPPTPSSSLGIGSLRR